MRTLRIELNSPKRLSTLAFITGLNNITTMTNDHLCITLNDDIRTKTNMSSILGLLALVNCGNVKVLTFDIEGDSEDWTYIHLGNIIPKLIKECE